MLGGAMGATVGLFGGGFVMSTIIGFSAGFLCSVINASFLLAIAYVVASLLSADFDDIPIGCSTTSQLSGILGGVGGALGALALDHLEISYGQSRDAAFALCWSITSFLPILMTIIIVRLARFRAADPEEPRWLISLLDSAEQVYIRYFLPRDHNVHRRKR